MTGMEIEDIRKRATSNINYSHRDEIIFLLDVISQLTTNYAWGHEAGKIDAEWCAKCGDIIRGSGVCTGRKTRNG